MKYITLLSLALSVALSVDAHCVPKNASKKEACSSLSEGGLLNLNALGCSETDISPTLNILSSRAPEKFRERALKHGHEKKSNVEICKSFSKAGLINLSALGCSENTIDPTINILSTRGLKHFSPERQKEICESFSKADFINLDILGCSKTDISPDINILSDLHHREVSEIEGFGELEKRSNGCYCPPPKTSHHHSTTKKSDHHHKTSTHTPKPTHKGGDHKPKTTSTTPCPTSTPTAKPKPGDGKCSGESQEEYCSSLSKAGLINLNILGCSKNKIDPTINILSNIGL